MRRLTQDRSSGIELIVLDAHGVVFNNPWSTFLTELAHATRRSVADVFRLWYEDLHDDAWLGSVSDDELWSRLTGRPKDGALWRDCLERRYEPSRVVPYLDRWRRRVPIWILSNHRSEWLLSRLARFDLEEHFDRVLVSDALGAMKPDPLAFRDPVAGVTRPDAALFVDDRQRNIDAARRLGLSAVLADPEHRWIDEVDRAVLGDA